MYANLIAAAALLAVPSVSAMGKAIVQNECSFPVYLWSVAATTGSMVSVPAGTNYTETYRVNTNGGGISIKIAAEQDQNAGITQFEYTLTDPTVWYDISNINGYPFESYGVTLTPTDSNCPVKDCDAGVEKCTNAYNVYNDDAATAACGDSADLVFVLCSGAGVTSSSSVAASSTKAASSSTKAVSSTQAAATSTKTSTSVVPSTTVSTVRQTSTVYQTTGTTFLTSTTSASKSSSTSSTTSTSSSKAVVTSAAAATSSNANEVVITTYVTSWTTIDGSEPTSTGAAAAAASSSTDNWHGRHSHGNKARSEEHRHVHRHARDIVA